MKKVFLKISQNSHENTCARVNRCNLEIRPIQQRTGAFQQRWRNLMAYTFSPFCLIRQILTRQCHNTSHNPAMYPILILMTLITLGFLKMVFFIFQKKKTHPILI